LINLSDSVMLMLDRFAPHAAYVSRKGEVSAWDNEGFLKTVRETGKKALRECRAVFA